MRRTLLFVASAALAAASVLPAAAQDATGRLAPGGYGLRLPGAGWVVAEVDDGGALATLVIPAATDLQLTAAGDLVVDDLLTPVPVDPPLDLVPAPSPSDPEDEATETQPPRNDGDEDDEDDEDDG